jgi:ATP dependent DNA ligase domain
MALPPMDAAKLTLVRLPFDQPDFLFELKHDGFRALAHIWHGKCRLVSHKRNSYKSFHSLRDNLATLKVKNAIIDGEIVCLDSEGRSNFKSGTIGLFEQAGSGFRARFGNPTHDPLCGAFRGLRLQALFENSVLLVCR